jgi:mannose-1-phosphate guanylyltransferase
VIVSHDTVDTHIINELGIPITVLGSKNMVVVATYDGILVSDKEASQRIKDIMKNHDNFPMYVERLWGTYRIIDYVDFEDYFTLTRRVFLKESKNLSYHVHWKRTETWTIIHGKGTAVIDNKVIEVGPGDFIHIRPGQYHSLKALTDLEFIEVQNGVDLLTDIHREYLTWEEIARSVGMEDEGHKNG